MILFICFTFYSDCIVAVCQWSAVLLWSLLSSPTPLIWNILTWATTSCRIQMCSSCLSFWRVHSVDWILGSEVSRRLEWCSSNIFLNRVLWKQRPSVSCKPEAPNISTILCTCPSHCLFFQHYTTCQFHLCHSSGITLTKACKSVALISEKQNCI